MSSRRAPNVKTAFQSMSWRESHLHRPASLILSTLAGEEVLQPKQRNYFRSFARLRWLRVLEEGNCVTNSATSTTNHKQKVTNNTLALYMKQHLCSIAIIMEVTTRSALILARTTVRCLPLRYNLSNFAKTSVTFLFVHACIRNKTEGPKIERQQEVTVTVSK